MLIAILRDGLEILQRFSTFFQESVVDCELIANVTISCYDELMLMDVRGRVQTLS